MNITISKRQQRLYQERGFDIERYEYLVQEGNALRKEILAIANEYNVDWDESRDAKDERVVEALAEKRKKEKDKKKKEEDDDDDDD